ncbi:MAG: sugar kinase [Treponema sp.]|nr:sugar kinase [Treponema sp.]
MKKIENRIVIVTRETRLKKVLESQNTMSQAKFYVKQLGGDFDEYETEHKQYHESVQKTRQDMEGLATVQILDRSYLPNFIFAPNDIVLAVGQDGLVANILKYLDGQPLIGVNPDPARWDGVLLPFNPKNAARIVEETAAGKRKYELVTMARARVQNGQELLAVNDFFIGMKGHGSARYIIKYAGVKENQSSSGVIVSTGLGSTGWMKSIIAGSNRISASVIGRPYGSAQESQELLETDEDEQAAYMMEAPMAEYAAPDIDASYEGPMPVQAAMAESSADTQVFPSVQASSIQAIKLAKPRARLKKKEYGISDLAGVVGKWSSNELLFAVREPFPSISTGTSLVFGKLNAGEQLRIESLMGENGVIFSDGIENDFIAFNSGTEAVISISDRKGLMVV